MGAMMALLSLIEGGVLEAHPTLRVGLLEAGCGFLPSVRLEGHESQRLVQRKQPAKSG
jgi:hypothetical protein